MCYRRRRLMRSRISGPFSERRCGLVIAHAPPMSYSSRTPRGPRRVRRRSAPRSHAPETQGSNEGSGVDNCQVQRLTGCGGNHGREGGEAERHRSDEVDRASHQTARRPGTIGDRRRARPKAITLEMRKAIEPTGPGPDQTSLLLHGQILDEGGTGADIEEECSCRLDGRCHSVGSSCGRPGFVALRRR